ncbi:hypothetical protein Tco_0907976, partial [Tanacetum coccineum]
GQKERDKPFKAITKQELASLRAQANGLFGNEKIWVEIPREILSVDEPEPQLLPNSLPLDLDLGDKRGNDPPINPLIPGSFRLKVVDQLTIHIPPSPHIAILSPRFNFRRTSLTGFPARSVRSSNAIALDSPYLLVLIIGTSQSRHHDKSESDSYYLSD